MAPLDQDQGGGIAPTLAAPVPHRLDPAIGRITLVVVIGAFMTQLDATMVNVSLTSLSTEFQTSLGAIQWVSSSYLLALALILPLSGWLVDRIGAKALYLWCFVAFTLASGLCGLAWSASSLIGFRILQGLSGGLLAPLPQMMLARAAGPQMARAIGIAAVPIMLAPLLGPVAAGAILESASWRWLFLINLPVGALALVLAAWFLPDDRAETRPRPLDFRGLCLLSPGLALFLYGTDHLGDRIGTVMLVAAAILLGGFWWNARAKGEAALIDLRLVRDRPFSSALLTLFLAIGISFAGQMLVPIYLIRAGGHSPSTTGWLMTPMGLGMMVTYPLLGLLTQRFGIRRLAAGGAVLGLIGTLPLLAAASQGGVPGTTASGLIEAGLFLRGLGLSAIGIPAITAGYAAIPRAKLAMATTAMNIVQRLGAPVLTTLVATLLGSGLGAGLAPSTPQAAPGAFIAAFGFLILVQVLLVLSTLCLPRSLTAPGRA